MSVTVHPPEGSQPVVTVVFEGIWTWDEFFSMHDQVDAIIDEYDREMDILIDFSKSVAFPGGFMGRADQMSGKLNPRARRLIFVEISSLPRFFLEMYRRLFPRDAARYVTVSSMDEARAVLAQPFPT